MQSSCVLSPRRTSIGSGISSFATAGTAPFGQRRPVCSTPSAFAKYYDEVSEASRASRLQRASTSNDVRVCARGGASAAYASEGGTRRASAGGVGLWRGQAAGSNSSTSPRASPSGSLSMTSVSPPPSSPSAPAECTMEYLADLVKEKKQLEIFPNAFRHLERLAEEEINRVRIALFQCDFATDDLHLPDPEGEVVCITEKLYVPRKEHPEYNFVGRILGPRGMTAKQLEQETGCKIMVRGKGSMRDKRKEEANRGKPNWEHLDDELHVLIQCEDTSNRASIKIRAAVEHVKKLLVPAPEGTDELKRKQLMELAIINGTYRPFHTRQNNDHARLLSTLSAASPIRPSTFYPLSPTGSPADFASSFHSNGLPSSPSAFDYSALMNQSFLDSLISSYHLTSMGLAASMSSALPQQGSGCPPSASSPPSLGSPSPFNSLLGGGAPTAPALSSAPTSPTSSDGDRKGTSNSNTNGGNDGLSGMYGSSGYPSSFLQSLPSNFFEWSSGSAL